MGRIWNILREKLAALREKAAAKGLPAGRIAYYAALIMLLALLGSATCAWRGQRAATPERAQVPQAAMALQTAASAMAPSPAPTEEPVRFVWPLDGGIVGEYAPQGLVWSETLSQWQNHPGLDIAGSPGEAVRACADGVVEDAWLDALWGNVAVIVHEDGYRSTYAGLNTLSVVESGQKVAAGEIISAVGIPPPARPPWAGTSTSS